MAARLRIERRATTPPAGFFGRRPLIPWPIRKMKGDEATIFCNIPLTIWLKGEKKPRNYSPQDLEFQETGFRLTPKQRAQLAKWVKIRRGDIEPEIFFRPTYEGETESPKIGLVIKFDHPNKPRACKRFLLPLYDHLNSYKYIYPLIQKALKERKLI